MTLIALYAAFAPELAHSLARRLAIIPTPKHGSWLNVAENELSALTRQCVKDCRFGTIEQLREAVEAGRSNAMKNKRESFGNSTSKRQE